ncbi:MAG: septum site-determining protein MinC [Alkaliphilus sp.]
MSLESIIEFKGSKKGIFVHIKGKTDYELIKLKMIEKLEESSSFFKGASMLEIQSDTITEEEKNELESLISEKYDIRILREESFEKEEESFFSGIVEGTTKFIHRTIRSGQRLYYEGNIVILGDVNPGAEVIADGNIVVMGNLRGIAHAGKDGNKNACIAAFNLAPTQLRIADFITRSPDDKAMHSSKPEIAKIHKGMLYIEPY